MRCSGKSVPFIFIQDTHIILRADVDPIYIIKNFVGPTNVYVCLLVEMILILRKLFGKT